MNQGPAGMGGTFGQQPPQGMKLQVDIAQMPNDKCECGFEIWEQGIVLKKISAIVSPDGQEHTGSIPVILCKKCMTLHPDSRIVLEPKEPVSEIVTE